MQLTPSRPAWRACVAAGGGATLWISLLVWVHGELPGTPAIDRDLHTWAIEHRDQNTVVLARAVSWFGQTNITLPAIAIAALVTTVGGRRLGRLRAAVALLAVGAIGTSAGLGLNRVIARARPPHSEWAGAAGGFAFPSGHTTAATLAAGLVAWSVSRRLRSRPARIAVWATAACWAGSVGWSRVWLGVHWPTDVVAGWLYAGTFLLIARAVQLGWPNSRWPHSRSAGSGRWTPRGRYPSASA